MIKKIFCVLLTIAFSATLAGCWNYKEIDDTANVAGIAIDRGENGFNYHLSAEIIDESDEKGAAGSTRVIGADGNTILEALRKLISISSRKLYLGHCKIMIISQDIAREGINPLLDVILRDHEIRFSTLILISQADTAKELLLLKGVGMPITSYGIENLLNSSKNYLNMSEKSQSYRLINALNTQGLSATLPVLKSTQLEKSDVTYQLAGLAAFRKDQMIGFLDPEETNLLLLMTGQLTGGTLTVPIEKDAYLTAEIFESHSKIVPVVENGQIKMEVKIEATVSINDLQSGILDEQSMKAQIEHTLSKEINELLRKIQLDYKSDILGFGRMVHLQNPKLWNDLKGGWEETFQHMPVAASFTTNIRGSGISRPYFKY